MFYIYIIHTYAYIVIYLYTYIHIYIQLNPFDLRVDREGWWFEHSCVIVVG